MRTKVSLSLAALLTVVPGAGTTEESLAAKLSKSYLELFEEAPRLQFSVTEIAAMRETLKRSEKVCVDRYKQEGKEHDQNLNQLQGELERTTRTITEVKRQDLHCKIQTARLHLSHARLLEKSSVPILYQNRLAKLDLIEKWPAEKARIDDEIRREAQYSRPYSNVKDIGFREVGKGQEDDIKEGQKAIDEMRKLGMLPKEIDEPKVREYVVDLAARVAARSDLRIPVKTTILDSQEINAFTLPGGYLFIDLGLLQAADDEAQLAGVIAHEISHAAARHGHKLMRKATIASIFYQAAQVATIIFTGGSYGIGTYYALQYGFYGLGLVLDLNLLGVSREYEMEADQLGVQYAWNAGYDPSGFIRFFDKMATKEGHVRGASWFRTHPVFYDRMMNTQREILFLPAKTAMIEQTTAFQQMKKHLEPVVKKSLTDEKAKPSLLIPESDCAKPKFPEDDNLCAIR